MISGGNSRFRNQDARWRSLALGLALALFPATLWPQYRESADQEPLLVADDYSVAMESQPEPIDVEHYVIDAELLPESHEIRARAQIRFHAREALSAVQFELNSNLYPTNITDAEGEVLSSRRMGTGDTLEISLRQRLLQDDTGTVVLEYEGPLESADYSPVEGVQLAYIGEELMYLLYPARWFPISGYRVDRYTAEWRLKVPAGYQVVSGGSLQSQLDGSSIVYTVTFGQPQFSGSLAVVRQSSSPLTLNTTWANVLVYFSPEHQGVAQAYAEAAAHMVSFFTDKFGPPAGEKLSIVEIDDYSLGGYAGPETVFLSPRAVGSEVNVRLLAQEVAQQWWRGLVGPASRADLWLDHGLATYSEALYLEELGGPDAIEARIREMSIDALTHDTIPIRAASRMPEFSPAYKTLLYDKAAYVMHMLRWVTGDEAYFAGLKDFARRYGYQGATTEEFRQVMEQASGQKLEGFFLQWFDSTGASDFTLDYTVYRTREGYRIAGQITQDKDLFSMPVEVRVETTGEPVTTRADVTGRSSEFSISTLDRPTGMVVDPNNRVLKYNDRIRVRVAIARGEQAVAERDYTQALEEYQQAIDVNRISSLAHYRVGEVFFALRNYQSAINAFREALNGDLDPAWTEVWSHIYMGKIFDVTGQRDRAVNSYQQAVRTRDNTQGAIDLANQYLKEPYQRVSEQADSGG
jgi:tetratricopeptide (TPR) repeat protein